VTALVHPFLATIVVGLGLVVAFLGSTCAIFRTRDGTAWLPLWWLHTLRVKRGAMPSTIVPESFVRLLAAFEDCFSAPSYRNFVTLVKPRQGILYASGPLRLSVGQGKQRRLLAEHRPRTAW